MTPPRIEVTVLVDSAAPSCEGDCVMDWLKPENQAVARRELARKHGDGAAVDFVDIRASSPGAPRAGLVRQTLAGNPRFPALLLNGNPRIAGPFDLRMLLDMVETEMDREL
ncbi:MAG: hypothetical protein HY673_20755 [Chloroflexi bacterium]|nr:hypothetical protein [Chloroflexota bacterium]